MDRCHCLKGWIIRFDWTVLEGKNLSDCTEEHKDYFEGLMQNILDGSVKTPRNIAPKDLVEVFIENEKINAAHNFRAIIEYLRDNRSCIPWHVRERIAIAIYDILKGGK